MANNLEMTTCVVPLFSLFPVVIVGKLNSNFSGNSFLSRNNSEYLEYNLMVAKLFAYFESFDSEIRLITVLGWRLDLRHHERGNQMHGLGVLKYSEI